ncbi:MAG TPA: DNA cytosine methyltransferase [Terriglobia bacterium]|nr:DNA cytosine methyltransferase [Terriglobia bacterium]
MAKERFTWYEFFAGGGLARLGLGAKWRCIFANEWCEKKAAAYRAYFGKSPELKVEDVAKLSIEDLPGEPCLAWASFPCQDLSLAGAGAGLDGERSGTFRPFWSLISCIAQQARGPKLIVLENVVGALMSHKGSDFAVIVRAFADGGYRLGAVVIDAVHFLPQSRPRLFVIGVERDVSLAPELICVAPSEPWHPSFLLRAHASLPDNLKRHWVWWNLPVPSQTASSLASVIEEEPTATSWHTEAETKRLLGLMSPLHRKKVAKTAQLKGRYVGTIYKRTRPNEDGVMAQRAEVRFDGISGCLRTPVGGSSRQTVIVVEDGSIRTRLLSPREAARLMGVSDDYPLPASYNEGYHIFGDGVAVPVVGWLEKHLLRPLAEASHTAEATKNIA